MTQEKSSYSEYIGIDIGKFTIEVGFTDGKKTYSYENSKPGFTRLWKEHKCRLKGSLVVVETTGWHEKDLLKFLKMKKVACHRASARQVKMFIRSYGILTKTDSIDARALAAYAKERAEHLVQYDIPDETQDKLQILHARYEDLVKMLVQEKNRLQAPGYEHVFCSIEKIIKVLQAQIAKMEDKIHGIISCNEVLEKKLEVLQSIDGVGKKTAIALLATMPELGKITRKKSAALAGLAPHANDSGKKQGYRRTKGGRPNVKNILHMASMGAVRKKGSELQMFYKRLTEKNNKLPMVALTAVKRKIITIANARIAQLNLS